MDPMVMEELNLVFITRMSPNVIGQLALDVMVNPPQPGDPSYAQYEEVIPCYHITLEMLVHLKHIISQPWNTKRMLVLWENVRQ